ncbi:19151_t:CDS:2, partial [Funneliformis geosporum]
RKRLKNLRDTEREVIILNGEIQKLKEVIKEYALIQAKLETAEAKLSENQLNIKDYQKQIKLLEDEAQRSKVREQELSQYYKSKRGRLTVNDEIIQELVKQLYGIEKERSENGYYDHKPLYIDHRAYNLV